MMTTQFTDLIDKAYSAFNKRNIFNERQSGSLEVEVHQKVKDLQGNSIFDGTVKHIYTFEDGLIKTMDIELV